MGEKTQEKGEARFLQRANRFLGLLVNGVEISILIFCVLGLAALLIGNVFARTFYQSIYFSEEVSSFLMILVTFAGVSYGARKAQHIRMGAFLDAMPPKIVKPFIFVISFVNALVLAIMAWFSYRYLADAMRLGHMTAALMVPKWTFYVVVPIGFGLASIQYVRTILKNFTESDPWWSPDQKDEYGDEKIGGEQV